MSVTFAQGFSAAGVAAGISAVEGKKDLALVVNNGPLDAAAGVFTSNRFCAAPVQWSRNIVSDGHVKAVILNSGGANACTGKPGYEQSKATAEKVAGLIGPKAEDVAVCSTGLIGELLPLDNVLSGADKAFETLADTAEAGADASHAIMTTDTKPKTVELEGSNGFRIGGMVKGSGMIAPQLATMLWRYAQSEGYDVSVGESTNILSYTDVANLADYAIAAMQWAVGAGIINGTGDGSALTPQGQATRAQAAVMLMRFCELDK